MSASADLQKAIEVLLTTPVVIAGVSYPPLSVPVPLVKRLTKSLPNDIEAALAASSGLCMYVMPPLPKQYERELSVVLVTDGDIRVRIIEQPALNATGVSAYELLDDVATTLHWRPNEAEWADPANLNPLKPILAQPLQIRSTDMIEGNLQGMQEITHCRIIDVVFAAVYQLNKTNP